MLLEQHFFFILYFLINLLIMFLDMCGLLHPSGGPAATSAPLLPPVSALLLFSLGPSQTRCSLISMIKINLRLFLQTEVYHKQRLLFITFPQTSILDDLNYTVKRLCSKVLPALSIDKSQVQSLDAFLFNNA